MNVEASACDGVTVSSRRCIQGHVWDLISCLSPETRFKKTCAVILVSFLWWYFHSRKVRPGNCGVEVSKDPLEWLKSCISFYLRAVVILNIVPTAIVHWPSPRGCTSSNSDLWRRVDRRVAETSQTPDASQHNREFADDTVLQLSNLDCRMLRYVARFGLRYFYMSGLMLEGGRSQQSVNMKADVWTHFRFNGRHIEMHRESWIVIESWVQGRFRLYATRSLNLEGRVCLKRQTNKKNWNIKFKKTKNKLFEDIERLQNHLFNVRFLFFQVELSLFVHFVPYV